jgi:hypothetical protein
MGNPLIISKVSWEDIHQLLAWTGADASREIHQLMIASLDFIPGEVIHHSVLAKGHFDHTRIYDSLIRNGGGSRVYRGIEIATVPQAPSRANGADETALWLAVLDDRMLLLGSEAMIQEELDRYEAGLKTDPTLLQRVGQLDPDDVAWSMVGISARRNEIDDFLSSLDPKLPRILSNGETLVFGVHFKRQIRLEFRVLMNPASGADGVSEPSTETLLQISHRSAFTFLPPERQIVRADVLLSRKAYMRWLAERDRAGPLH